MREHDRVLMNDLPTCRKKGLTLHRNYPESRPKGGFPRPNEQLAPNRVFARQLQRRPLQMGSTMSLRSLNEWEVSLIKAFSEQTDLNDQQVLAYFTRPNRTLNHRVISGIRAGRYFPSTPPSTEEELGHFKDRWRTLNISKGKIREIEELLLKSREAMISAIQSYNNPAYRFGPRFLSSSQ
jgi:hypothetical protein